MITFIIIYIISLILYWVCAYIEYERSKLFIEDTNFWSWSCGYFSLIPLVNTVLVIAFISVTVLEFIILYSNKKKE